MYHLGHHLYKGDIHALGRNAEDAHLWLSRFLAALPAGPYVRLTPLRTDMRVCCLRLPAGPYVRLTPLTPWPAGPYVCPTPVHTLACRPLRPSHLSPHRPSRALLETACSNPPSRLRCRVFVGMDTFAALRYAGQLL